MDREAHSQGVQGGAGDPESARATPRPPPPGAPRSAEAQRPARPPWPSRALIPQPRSCSAAPVAPGLRGAGSARPGAAAGQLEARGAPGSGAAGRARRARPAGHGAGLPGLGGDRRSLLSRGDPGSAAPARGSLRSGCALGGGQARRWRPCTSPGTRGAGQGGGAGHPDGGSAPAPRGRTAESHLRPRPRGAGPGRRRLAPGAPGRPPRRPGSPLGLAGAPCAAQTPAPEREGGAPGRRGSSSGPEAGGGKDARGQARRGGRRGGRCSKAQQPADRALKRPPAPAAPPGLAPRPRTCRGQSLRRSHAWPGGEARDSELPRAWERHGAVGPVTCYGSETAPCPVPARPLSGHRTSPPPAGWAQGRDSPKVAKVGSSPRLFSHSGAENPACCWSRDRAQPHRFP
ncbi:hypothetical protein VULLAG_LOCUS21557 [Vulpes lagopus]